MEDTLFLLALIAALFILFKGGDQSRQKQNAGEKAGMDALDGGIAGAVINPFAPIPPVDSSAQALVNGWNKQFGPWSNSGITGTAGIETPIASGRDTGT